MNAIQQSLPIVASALAEQSGITLSIGGTTAFTNGKHVNIPALPLDCSPKTAMLAYGNICHEGGHCRYTDFSCQDRVETPFEWRILNVLEDGRIEKKMMKDFPGARYRLEGLSQILDVESGPLPDEPPIIFFNFVLLTVMTSELEREWVLPVLAPVRQQFIDTFGQNVLVKIEALVSGTSNMPATISLLPTVQAIVQTLKDAMASEQEEAGDEQQQPDGDDADPEGDAGDSQQQPDGDDADPDGDAGDSHQQPDGDDADPDGDAGDSQQQPDGDDADPDGDAGDSQQQPDGDDTDPDGDAGDSQQQPDGDDTDPDGDAGDSQQQSDGGDPSGQQLSNIAKAIKRVLEASEDEFGDERDDKIKEALELAANQATGTPVSMMAKHEADSTEKPDFTPSPEVADSVRQLRYRLRSVLQAQAKTRHAFRESGTRLAGSRLFRLQSGKTDVFRHTETRRGVNTAISLLIDQSGSTAETATGSKKAIYEVATDASYALAEAVEGIKGVSMAVNAFPHYNANYEAGIISVKKFGQPLRHAKGSFGTIAPDGTTPMAEALLAAAVELFNRDEDRKVLICTTDGEPDDGDALLVVVKEAEKMGIEVVGIGIGSASVKQFFDDHLVINSVEDLSQSLIATLQRLLV